MSGYLSAESADRGWLVHAVGLALLHVGACLCVAYMLRVHECRNALSGRVVAPDDDVVHVGGVGVQALGDLRLQSVVVQARQAAKVLARNRRSTCLKGRVVNTWVRCM